ncbi:primosomal protein [Micrococcales bacterium 31B]|nr:primosomal protein [Micrococcales bacterium 31B]
MSTDPRAALERLTLALENHLNALERRRGEDDPSVDRAFETLEDACEAYDDAIFTVFNETLPFVSVDDSDDEDDDDDDDADEEFEEFDLDDEAIEYEA